MLPTAAGASRGQGSVTTAAQTTQIATTGTTTREEHKQPQVQPLWRRHYCQQGGQVEESKRIDAACPDGPQRVPFCSVHKFFTTFEKSATMAIKLILPATNYATPPCRTTPPPPLHTHLQQRKRDEKGRETANKITQQWQNKICIKNKLQQKSGRKENKKRNHKKQKNIKPLAGQTGEYPVEENVKIIKMPFTVLHDIA